MENILHLKKGKNHMLEKKDLELIRLQIMRKLINKSKKKHTKSNSFKYKLTKVMKPMK